MQITIQIEGLEPFTQSITEKPTIGQVLKIKIRQQLPGSSALRESLYQIKALMNDGDAYIVTVEPYTEPVQPVWLKRLPGVLTGLMVCLAIGSLVYDYQIRLSQYILSNHPTAQLAGYSVWGASKGCTSNRVFRVDGKTYLACTTPLTPGIFEKQY